MARNNKIGITLLFIILSSAVHSQYISFDRYTGLVPDSLEIDLYSSPVWKWELTSPIWDPETIFIRPMVIHAGDEFSLWEEIKKEHVQHLLQLVMSSSLHFSEDGERVLETTPYQNFVTRRQRLLVFFANGFSRFNLWELDEFNYNTGIDYKTGRTIRYLPDGIIGNSHIPSQYDFYDVGSHTYFLQWKKNNDR